MEDLLETIADQQTQIDQLRHRLALLEKALANKRQQQTTPLARELTGRILTAFRLPDGFKPTDWLTASEIAEEMKLEPSKIKPLGHALKAAGFTRKTSNKDGKIAARYCVVREQPKAGSRK